MQVKPETVRMWRRYLEYGDMSKMEQELGISRMTINKAFRGLSVSEETVNAIKSFIEKKKQLLAA